jgi:hypothetical protein
MNTEETKVPEVKPDGQPTTPIVEAPKVDELASLKAQLEVAQKEKATIEANWKNEQRNTSKKEQEIQKLRSTHDDISVLKDSIKILAAELATVKGESEDEFGKRTTVSKEELLKRFDELDLKRKQLAEQEKLSQLATEYKQRTEEAGLTPKDEDYHTIRGLVTRGEFELADIKLNKITQAKVVDNSKKENVVSDEKVIEEKAKKMAEEMYRKKLEDEGKLTTGVSQPAGGSMSADDLFEKYASGEIDTNTYKTKMKSLGKNI